jgi:anthranilate phosphoribosyltransferase
MLNPLRAASSIQSIFHPAYAALHQQADSVLQQPRAMVFKGESGEVEIKPQADTRLHLLADSQSLDLAMERRLDGRVAPVSRPDVEPLRGLWRASNNELYGLEAVLGTAAAGLVLLEPTLDLATARDKALSLWRARDKGRLG